MLGEGHSYWLLENWNRIDMQSHEIDYEIKGHDVQLVEVTLDPGEAVIAEAGAMIYMEDGIRFETKMGDGANPDQGVVGKLFSAGKRMITGETVFMTHFTNEGERRSAVAFSAPVPGSVVAVNLEEIGGELICQRDSFLCAALGTKIGIAFSKKLGAGFFGGEGFIRPVYFSLLAVHVVGAIAILPLVPLTLYRALTGRFDKHKRVARWTWPIWVFVGVSGVVVYVMAVHMYPHVPT